MENHPIVLATNLSAEAGFAARWARDMAAAFETGVVVSHAVDIDMGQPLVAALDLALTPAALEEVREGARAWYVASAGAPPSAVDSRVGHVASALIASAQKHEASVLVMARSDKGRVARLLAGSRVQQLASHPPCPLIVVHEDHEAIGEGPVAVATDFSEANRPALDFACRFAEVVGRELELVHCVDLPSIPVLGAVNEVTAERVVAWSASATDRLARSLGEDHPGLVVHHRLLNGVSSETLADYIRDESPSLMVLGQTGHGLKLADLLGSVPRKLLNQGVGTVAVVPPT